MTVTVNHERHSVVLTGEKFVVDLTWSQALLLGTLLREASVEAEPPTPLDLRYEPKQGRWG